MFRHCQNSTVNIVAGPGRPSDLQCPTPDALAAFETAAKQGVINWHAFPFNAEPEAYDAGMFEASLNLTFAEDEYFGLPKRMTYSQRDVPVSRLCNQMHPTTLHWRLTFTPSCGQ